MFKIQDGRDKFYQWDLNRKLIVEDSSITQVHFSNAIYTTALVCEVIDGIVNVPNIILQDEFDIYVYGYDRDYTKHSAKFNVVKRTKPESYVYTETEILNYYVLLDRINAVDENIVEYVDNAISAIPQPDLSGYALKTEIPSTAGLATEKYVDDAIAAIDLPDPTVAASGVTFDDTAAGIGAANVQEAIEYLADSGITSEVVQEQIDENLGTFNRYIHLYGILTDDVNITEMNSPASAASMDELFYKLQTTGSCSYAGIGNSIFIPSLIIIQRDYIGFNKITKILEIYNGGDVKDKTSDGIGMTYYAKAIMLPGILVFFTGHTAGSDGEGLGYQITTNRLKRVREYLGLPNLLTVQEQLNNIGNLIDGNEVSY